MHPLLDLSGHPVIGHRGAAGRVPENTIESMRHAVSVGVEAVECDVRLSADGVPVVHHDPTVDRTTDGAGPLRELTVARLGKLDAGFRFDPEGTGAFPYRGRGLRVPTVAEVLEAFPALPLLIELKTVDAALPLRELLRRRGAAGRVILASFQEAALLPFLEEAGWLTGASQRGILPLWIRSRFWFGAPIRRYDIYAVPDRHRGRIPVPSRRFVAMARRAGCPVHVWTVDRPEAACRFWDLGVSGIISNVPDLILPARDRRFPEERPRATVPG